VGLVPVAVLALDHRPAASPGEKDLAAVEDAAEPPLLLVEQREQSLRLVRLPEAAGGLLDRVRREVAQAT
jgi:hypothetical protein